MSAIHKFEESFAVETICSGGSVNQTKQMYLRAGRLTMIYENGSLRSIALGKCEIVRMINSAVRDKAWLTAKAEISDEVIDIKVDSFQIQYKCSYQLADIQFLATYSITGDSDSSISFEMRGESITTFQKSRIGFCLLHPIEECAGKQCLISHTNGEQENTCFPTDISPAQPFKDIISMEWMVSGSRCTVDFYGDIFETEDHRNWTDASFKTYCTPLDLPYPVTVRKGERITQRIDLKVNHDGFQSTNKDAVNQIVLFPDQLQPLPRIGIGQSTRPQNLSPNEILILKELQFDHYRIDLYLFNDEWKLKAELSAREAIQLGYPVMFALLFDEHYINQANVFIEWVLGKTLKIGSIMLFHKILQATPDYLTDAVAPIFRLKIPGIQIGIGTNANFAQLNRNRPVSENADYVLYSIHPQEHATDNQSLTENLKAQEYTVRSAGAFANGKQVWISPVNMQRRFNANLENFEHPASGELLPPQVDVRLMTLYGACWSAISLKYLSESGVSGCTYFETTGERGIIQGDYNSRWPEAFPSKAGMVFPVFHIFRYILAHKGLRVMKSQSSNPLQVDSLILTNGTIIKAIVVNFTEVEQKVVISGFDCIYNEMILDIESFAQFVSNPEWNAQKCNIPIGSENILLMSPFSIRIIVGSL